MRFVLQRHYHKKPYQTANTRDANAGQRNTFLLSKLGWAAIKLRPPNQTIFIAPNVERQAKL